MNGDIIKDLDWEAQDRLYALKCDIRICTPKYSELFPVPEVSYLFWQTCTDGRYTGIPFMWMAELFTSLAHRKNVQLCLDELIDSPGDGWLQVSCRANDDSRASGTLPPLLEADAG